MAYLKIVESTETWVCPKDATYKVICVAGGCNVANAIGGASSFGGYLKAEGTMGGRIAAYQGSANTFSMNPSSYITGYTLTDYAVPINGSITSPIGYGGGEVYNSTIGTNVSYYAAPGKLMVGFFEIRKDTEVVCVVGEGATQTANYAKANPGVVVIMEAGPITSDDVVDVPSPRKITYNIYNGSSLLKSGTIYAGELITLSTLNATATQNFSGYRIDNTGTVYKNTYKTSNTTPDEISFYAYFTDKPKYNVSFNSHGSTIKTTQVMQGEKVASSLVPTPTNNLNYDLEFFGWTTTPIATIVYNKPAAQVPSDNIVTSNTNYYAIRSIKCPSPNKSAYGSFNHINIYNDTKLCTSCNGIYDTFTMTHNNNIHTLTFNDQHILEDGSTDAWKASTIFVSLVGYICSTASNTSWDPANYNCSITSNGTPFNYQTSLYDKNIKGFYLTDKQSVTFTCPTDTTPNGILGYKVHLYFPDNTIGYIAD